MTPTDRTTKSSAAIGEHSKALPTGRVRRTAKVGGLLGAEVARAYANKAGNLVRSQEDRRAADERRRLKPPSLRVRRAAMIASPDARTQRF